MGERAVILASIFFLLHNLTLSLRAGPAQGGARRISASVPVLPLNDLKPGMKGTIRTVFRGDQIEEFGFEVLGIMKNLLGPKQDVILVQLRGAKPEFTGVVSGMSGSPAYIDGKLIGALSFRFGIFAKEPIAGVTPIESMLSLLEITEQKPPSRAAGPGPWDPAPAFAVTDPSGDTGPNPRPQPASDPAPLLEPIPTPLFFSGFRQETVDRFARVFRRHHLIPIRGGGGSLTSLQFSPENTSDFVPGAPVSAVLVGGDLGIYATGTLSYRDKDRVLAFGHPFFQIGYTNMPMAKASILTTLASELASFKIAELKEIVGTIRQDRLTAIKGQIGVKPEMIPVRVDVQSPFRGQVPYRYEVFQHPFLTPLLFDITLFESILGSLEQSDEMTIEYDGTVRISGHPDVRFKDRFTSSDYSLLSPVPFEAASQIGGLFNRLFNNGFETPKITGVEISFRVREERRSATIEELRVEREEVRPGEEINVYAFLRPYRGDLVLKTFRLKIPERVTRGDQLTVAVSDAAALRMKERRLAPTNPGSLDRLIEVLNRDRTGDRVYCHLSQTGAGYFINDQLFPSLPLSVMSVIDSSRISTDASRINESLLLVLEQEAGQVVRGNRRLTLTVR